MKLTIAFFLALVVWSIPGSAYACSGWIDCWLGISSTVEIRQSQQTERERITAERDEQIAGIEAEKAEREQQAHIEVERVKQQQYASEAQRDIAIAQAQQQAEQYKTMIAGLTSEKIAGIQSNADSQIAALQAQAQIAIAGITETGATERYRVAGGWLFAIVAVVVVAFILVSIIRRQPTQPQQTIVLLSDPTAYPRLENHLKEIEVKHARRYLSQN